MSEKTTLTEWNIRNAKKREKPVPRLKRLKPVNLDALAAKAESSEPAAFACLECSDTGFVLATRMDALGRESEYSTRCLCAVAKRQQDKPAARDDIPI